MGQTTDQITTDIQQSRDELRSNFEELENKVKSVTDWKQYFQKSPATLMAVAFGVGAVIATTGVRRKAKVASGERPSTSGLGTSGLGRKHDVLDTWDNVKSALVGVAATQVTGFLGRVVPGFQDQFHKTAASHTGPLSVGNGERRSINEPVTNAELG